LPAYPKHKRISLPRNSVAWKKLVLEVFERDGYTCQFCDNPFTFEYLAPCHIKSVGSGGDDTKENIKAGCKKCHLMLHTGEIHK